MLDSIVSYVGIGIAVISILLVVWDHFKDNEQLYKQVQRYYNNIKNLIVSHLDVRYGIHNKFFNTRQSNNYYKFLVVQNLAKNSEYLGLTYSSEEESYYNDSEYMIYKTGQLWIRNTDTDKIKAFSYDNLDNDIKNTKAYLKTLREFWNTNYSKIFLRPKLKDEE